MNHIGGDARAAAAGGIPCPICGGEGVEHGCWAGSAYDIAVGVYVPREFSRECTECYGTGLQACTACRRAVATMSGLASDDSPTAYCRPCWQGSFGAHPPARATGIEG
jgi:hypothetical protein